MQSQNLSLEDVREKVKAAIDLLQKEHNIPAITVGIVYNTQQISWTQGQAAGHHLNGNVPAGGDFQEKELLFGIGSLTKAFTSAAIAMAIQTSDFNWDTPLIRIFGEDFRFQDSFRTSKACLRDLLAHKMGIELGETAFSFMCGNIDRNEFIKKLFHVPCAVDFRTKLMYNNLMYALAGLVIEQKTGFKFEEYVDKNLFGLLGMENTSFFNKGSLMDDQMAKPHVMCSEKLKEVNLDIHRQIHGVSACGGIMTSASDMCKWIKFLLSKGKVKGIQIIEQSLLEECWRPQFALPSGKPEWSGYVSLPDFPVTETRDTYGFGWYLGTYRGYRTIAHSGEFFGYDSLLTVCHHMNFGIYTNMNGPSGEPAYISNQLLHYYISDLLLGLEPWLDHKTMVSFPEPWRPRNGYFIPRCHVPIDGSIKPKRPLFKYEGNFHHPFLGCAIVKRDCESETLILYLGETGQFKLLTTNEDDVFRMEGVGILDFLHQWDLYAPTHWMMVKFDVLDDDVATSMVCSLFESAPVFKKVVFFLEEEPDSD